VSLARLEQPCRDKKEPSGQALYSKVTNQDPEDNLREQASEDSASDA
jgi:hypothetical protein